MYRIMTAGPTQVRENVRIARSQECSNPDLDQEFFDFYRETCSLLSKAMHTENKALILGGEGILGLEAACASLTEPGDRVLIIDNGIFGKGFADFVTIYGGNPVLFTMDYHKPVEIETLQSYLEQDHDFKYATVVHCDTPSGVLNDVEGISKILDSYGIMTVTDSVAGMFGEPLDLSDSKIDILCGGSQKALSAPPGLTMLWVSERAFRAMEDRKTPIASFYANILLFRDYYEQKAFPYTMPISDIKGLRTALDNFLEDEEVYQRHAGIAAATRKALTAGGIELYLESGWSNTVTVLKVPEGITDQQLLHGMEKDYNIMISGCFDVLAGKVVRIGHMGENAYPQKVAETLAALQGTLEKLGVTVLCDMTAVFSREI
ncbi:pyridoxal-phosphate-dependent aminotransferase family protein [Emergencia sp.]|uniref:pyridoxal-phosphate-dependent aminotransferase family protein n=1 Tax=Emergencia sp. TaxID=1926557 RepID=UPI003AEFEC98